jgi:hypothetical protein
MASITRSMAFAKAVRPLTRQSTLNQSSSMLRRQSAVLKTTRIAAFQTSARKSALLPVPPRMYLCLLSQSN